MCAFMPEYHWLPFFEERISGSRFCAAFFVDGDAAISVASTMVPPQVHGVEPICKVLTIAPSTYHDHAAKRHDDHL